MKTLKYPVPIISEMVQEKINEKGLDCASEYYDIDKDILTIFDDRLIFMDDILYVAASKVLKISFDELTFINEINEIDIVNTVKHRASIINKTFEPEQLNLNELRLEKETRKAISIFSNVISIIRLAGEINE